MPHNHRERKLNRLKGYDYSQDGYYFITICTRNRQHFFGDIESGILSLNKYGEIAQKYWLDIPKHYENCMIDEFIIMPNHVHGIIIVNNVGTEQCSVPTNAQTKRNYGLLSKIIKSYKEICVKTIHKEYENHEFGFQRSFYDHIIRDEKSLDNIREYIKNNPQKWETDRNNDGNLYM